MTLVAIYARVSTVARKSDKDRGQDTENQLHQLREFCARMGWTVFREYVDRKSGKNGNREQYQALFADASKRQFDLVLFWSLDRFSREGTLATLRTLQTLTDCGVGYRSFTEQYLDSCGAMRDVVIALLSTIAKQELVRMSERIHAGLDRKARSCRICGLLPSEHDGQSHTHFPKKILGRPRVKVVPNEVKKLRAQGKTWAQIQTATGLSRGTAQRACALGREISA